MHAEIITITPDFARNTLARNNTENRPIRHTHVDSLASAIKRGEWVLNGDAIRFLSDGTLADGQHRLAAIAQAEIAVQSVVVRGVSARAFVTIDKGVKRTTGDILTLAGHHNANCLGGSLRLLFKWLLTSNPYNSTAAYNPTDAQIIELLGRYPEAPAASSLVYGSRFCKAYVGPSLTAFLRVVFARNDAEAAAGFFAELESGANLAADSPVYLLRERLLRDSGDKTKITSSYKAALLFKAFRFYRDGCSAKTLRVRTEGEHAEQNLFSL